MFDREGGEVSIGDEIARCAQRFEEPAHENEVPLSPDNQRETSELLSDWRKSLDVPIHKACLPASASPSA